MAAKANANSAPPNEKWVRLPKSNSSGNRWETKKTKERTSEEGCRPESVAKKRRDLVVKSVTLMGRRT